MTWRHGATPALAGLLLTLPVLAAERWEVQYFYDRYDSTLALLDLQFPSPQQGVALGVVLEGNRRRPVVVVTGDGGRKWELLPLKEPGRSLYFLNPQAGWMVGERGRLWSSADAGRTWAPMKASGVKATPLRVFFADAFRGWLLCSQKQVYSTTDGGQSWRLLEASQKPDLPPATTLWAAAAFQGPTGLLAGWSRPGDSAARLPEWMDPERAWGRSPATTLLLHTADGGQTWKFVALEKLGQVARLAWSGDRPLLLAQRADSLEAPTRILSLDLQALKAQQLYSDNSRWLTDVAVAGKRLLAAGVAVSGRAPAPSIPARLVIIERTASGRWVEMAVDYRAEARRAVLAAAGEQAWIATDTGMILNLVNR